MQLFLDHNRIQFEALTGPNSPIAIPFNAGRRTGYSSPNPILFRATPPAEKIDLTTWINSKIADGSIDVSGSSAAFVTTDTTQTISGAKTFSNQSLSATAIPTYADNTAAVAGGLAVGRIYKTAAGELRIVVA